MNILIDENIPFAEEFFGNLGTIQRFPGRELAAKDLKETDILLVRSITKVNQALLSQAQQLKFVGTATIGEDHIDKPLLAQRGIRFSSAPGCNAVSVAEYVISALLVLSEKYHFDFRDKTVAIVGVGNIGKALRARLEVLGCKLLLVDPVREKNEYAGKTSPFMPLNEALAQADIVTFHTPLTRQGEDATFHLLNESNLPLLKDDVVLINACRGEVISNAQLLAHIKQRQAQQRPRIKLALDVWEGEPNPLKELFEHSDLASAHIAGYSLEGKSRGTEILYQQVCRLLGIEPEIHLSQVLPAPDMAKVQIQAETEQLGQLKQLVHLVYDVRRDDALFRQLLDSQGFDWLRKNYPLRREWSSLQVEIDKKSPKISKLCQLGFAI